MRCLALALSIALSASGCSLVLVKPYDEQPITKEREPDCSRAVAWPIVDVVGASLAVVVAGNAASSKPATETTPAQASNPTIALSGLAAVLAGAGSAYYGFTRTATCRKAHRDWERATLGQGLVKATIAVRNGFSESIFGVVVSSDDVEKTMPLRGTRVARGSEERAEFGAYLGAEVALEVFAESLGKTQRFSVETTMREGTLTLYYDWDVATASFRVVPVWND